jgi:hypothetical protein
MEVKIDFLLCFYLLIRLQEVLYLVQEVYNTSEIFSSKSPFSKKTQATLKSVLKSIFPKNGNFSNFSYYLYLIFRSFGGI